MGKVMQIDEYAPAAIREALDNGELSINQGYNIIRQVRELHIIAYRAVASPFPEIAPAASQQKPRPQGAAPPHGPYRAQGRRREGFHHFRRKRQAEGTRSPQRDESRRLDRFRYHRRAVQLPKTAPAVQIVFMGVSPFPAPPFP